MVNLTFIMFKKTLRDLKKLMGPALVLSTVLAAGLSSLIMSQTNFRSLETSQKVTYRKLEFTDAIVPLVSFPRERLHILELIPGIRKIDCRISESGQVRLPASEKPIFSRFHSLPETNSLNQIVLLQGRLPNRDAPTEAVLSDAFAKAWKIKLGDQIEILLKGKLFRLEVTGLGRSAEYIYQAGSAASIPDDKLFSAWWLNRRVLETTSNLQSSCNEILISTQSGHGLQKAEPELAEQLKYFGYTQIIPRKRILSHYFLDSELSQLRAMSIYIPAVFLLVTLFLLNITMTRVLLTQRESIGTLRAFGFPTTIIAGHAFLLSFGCLFPGLLMGILFGLWLSEKMFALYILFYRFAFTVYEVDQSSLTLCVVLCFLTTVLGSWRGLKSLYAESPAQALVAAAPRHTQASRFDTVFFVRILGLLPRMSLRNIFRRPLQSTITLLGLILATILFLFSRFEADAINQLLEMEFSQNQRQSHSVFFSQRLPPSVQISVESQLGQVYSESSLTLPVTLKYGLHVRELTLIVKNSDEILRNKNNIENKSLAQSGLSLSKSIADVLKIVPPAQVTIITQDRKPKSVSIDVTELSDNLMGTVAVIDRRNFQNLFTESLSLNTVLLKTPYKSSINESLLFSRWPVLVSVREKIFERKSFEQTMAENIGIFQNFMIGFALLIAIGVLYNNSRIQFAEREREFALMRALGFFEAEITLLFWSDFIVLALAAVGPGLFLGRKILQALMRALETEVFRIPLVLTAESYLWTASFLFLSVFFTAILIQPQIHRIAFLSILKTRE